MPDLPPVNKKVLPLAVEIQVMKRGGSNENQKPHKLFMLLAVLDLLEEGQLTDNRVYFNQPLIDHFEKYFREYAGPDDWCQPGPPFFHLRSTSFWKHKVKPGREEVYAKIKTSGGGVKRIQENIEYAEINEHTFLLLKDDRLRNELREFILSLLKGPETMEQKDRIATVFHEDFALSRASIVQVLKAFQLAGDGSNLKSKEKREELLREQTQLGTNYVKAMPEYAKGAGLIDFSYCLTPFGRFALNKDPLLEQPATQWLMHYYLSAPLGPGPLFWHRLVISKFRSGDVFTQEELADQIGETYQELKGTVLSERKLRSTSNIFLETYVQSKGLGGLGLLNEATKNSYEVGGPELPSTWTVAAALLDTCHTQFSGQVTINLKDITTESNLANIFMISRSRLEMILGEMQEEGIVELFRIAPPYQVALLQSDPAVALERMYSL